MEKKILLVGATKIHSKKNGEDYYVIEYVDKLNNRNKEIIKNINEFDEKKFNRIKSKVISGEVTEVIGIFEANGNDRIELVDIK